MSRELSVREASAAAAHTPTPRTHTQPSRLFSATPTRNNLFATPASPAPASAVGTGTPARPAANNSSLRVIVRVSIHQSTFSEDELIVNARSFPTFRPGDLVGVTKKATSEPAQILYLKVAENDSLKGSVELSLLASAASAAGLLARDMIEVFPVIRFIDVRLEAVELSFDRCYIGRSDHFRVKNALVNQAVYNGKQVTVSGMRMRVDTLSSVHNPTASVLSGVIDSGTKLTFRSRSARLFFLIQLSEEMWEYSDSGEIYFEKVIKFLTALLMEWIKVKASHAVSIILFSRTLMLPINNDNDDDEDDEDTDEWRDWATEEDEEGGGNSNNNLNNETYYACDRFGRVHADHYSLVIDNFIVPDEDSENWADSIGIALKERFHQYPTDLSWDRVVNISPDYIHYTDDESKRFGPALLTNNQFRARRVPSNSVDGNFLEAINCAVSIYDKHFIDRDLTHTGQNILLMSAGHGLFHVDTEMATLTKQRMVDAGIGCDLICVTKPPLHAVPLFIYSPTFLEKPHQFIHEQYLKSTRPSSLKRFHSVNVSMQHPSSMTNSHNASYRSLSRLDSSASLSSTSSSSNEDYSVPHWISLYFLDRDTESSAAFNSLSSCKLYDFRLLHPVSLSEWLFSEKKNAINVPNHQLQSGFTEPRKLPTKITDWKAQQQYDDAIFAASSSTTETHSVNEERSLTSSGSFNSLPVLNSFSPAFGWKLTFARRWAHLFTAESKIDGYAVNWKSLCKPAMLPLTVDYAPKPHELKSRYREYFYTLAIDEHREKDALSQSDIMDELICERLAHDFQIITKQSVTAMTNTVATTSSTATAVTTSDNSHTNTMPASFSPPNELEAPISEIHPQLPAPAQPCHEQCAASVDASRVSLPSGPGAGFIGKILNRTARRKAESAHDTSVPVRRPAAEISSTTAAIGRAVQTRSPSLQSTSAPPPRKPADSCEVWLSLRNQIHCLALDRSLGGVTVKRFVHERVIANLTLPRLSYHYYLHSPLNDQFQLCHRLIEPALVEQTDWNHADQILTTPDAEYTDTLRYRRVRLAIIPNISIAANTASDGARIAVFEKLIQQTVGAQVDSLGIRTPSPGSPSAPQPHDTLGSFSVPLECQSMAGARHTADSLDADFEGEFGFAYRGVIERMTRVSLAVSRANSFFFLRYETFFHPRYSYHLELHWLVATGVHMDAWLKALQRRAEKLGMTLVKIPSAQRTNTADPFHTPLRIRFNPVKINDSGETSSSPTLVSSTSSVTASLLMSSMHAVLLCECGFVPDTEVHGRAIYLHSTGAALIRTMSDGILFLANPTDTRALAVFSAVRYHWSQLMQTREALLALVDDIETLVTQAGKL